MSVGLKSRRQLNDSIPNPKAERNHISITEYIAKEFGDETAQTFIKKADDTCKLLENFPHMGLIENNDVRGFQLSRQTRVFYKIKGQKIIILSFFDVRTNPKKRFD